MRMSFKRTLCQKCQSRELCNIIFNKWALCQVCQSREHYVKCVNQEKFMSRVSFMRTVCQVCQSRDFYVGNTTKTRSVEVLEFFNDTTKKNTQRGILDFEI